MKSPASLFPLARVLSCSILCLGASIASAVAADAEPPTSSVAAPDPLVMTINGDPVTAAEYRLVMRRRIAGIYGQFQRDKNLEDHAAYWSADSGPGGPLAKLREAVAAELVRIKISQALARRHGLADDTSFANFQKQLETENARRAAAAQDGGILYGPQSYRPGAYYYVRLRDLEARLKQTMARAAESRISDAEIERYYADNRASFGKKPIEEIRLGILSALARQKSAAELDRLCAEARVEVAAVQLARITPRSDAPAPASAAP